VIMQLLGTYHHNFVTHLLEARLQQRVYALAEAGQAVTATLLNRTKGEVLQAFWGDAVEIDDGARMTWMRQPHYYMGLYPYTYSVGLVAATAMSEPTYATASWIGCGVDMSMPASCISSSGLSVPPARSTCSQRCTAGAPSRATS